MLVQSWLQVPYTEHSSKSARRGRERGHLPCNEGKEVGARRPHPRGCLSLTATLEDKVAESITRRDVDTSSPSKAGLGICPSETAAHVHIVRSFGKDFLRTCSMPGTVLGSEDAAMNEIYSNCCPHEI